MPVKVTMSPSPEVTFPDVQPGDWVEITIPRTGLEDLKFPVMIVQQPGVQDQLRAYKTNGVIYCIGSLFGNLPAKQIRKLESGEKVIFEVQ